MPQYLLIADDLTGACDAGAQFAKRGLSSEVIVDLDKVKGSDADVWIVNSRSRADTPEDAARKLQAYSSLVSKQARPVLFKKIDSTLRGPVAAEIEAAMAVFGCRTALIAPAFPAMGRAQRGGVMVVRDATGETSLGVLDLLRSQMPRPRSSLVLVGRFASSVALRKHLEELVARDIRYIVFDAEAESDLQVIAEAGKSLPDVLWVGSGGLASGIAGVSANPEVASSPPMSKPIGVGPVVFCVGSTHAVTRRQVRTLVARARVCIVNASPEGAACAKAALREDCGVVLQICREATEGDSLCQFFQEISDWRLGAMLLTGGDTGDLVCHALRVLAIRLESEVSIGIPWGVFRGGMAEGVPVVTKAGGFGADDALLRVLSVFSKWSFGAEVVR